MNTHGPVEPDKDNIRQEPYTLPQGFTWDALDLGDRGVVSTGSWEYARWESLGWHSSAWTLGEDFGDGNISFSRAGDSVALSQHLLGLGWVWVPPLQFPSAHPRLARLAWFLPGVPEARSFPLGTPLGGGTGLTRVPLSPCSVWHWWGPRSRGLCQGWAHGCSRCPSAVPGSCAGTGDG